ncbi:MAG: hypothetical protein HY335_10275 [Deinococcus sp.]|nr:hypothetical protein [Deinococcus sp.]
MRRMPLLIPLSMLLAVLLAACPAPGPSLTFTGIYMATIGPNTITVVLTQTGANVTGTFNATGPPPAAGTIDAIVTAPGVAQGGLLILPPPAVPIHLFLTVTNLDLVLQVDAGEAAVLERQ